MFRIVLVAILVAGSIGLSVRTSSASPVGFYVESTGHTLADPFLEYWIEHGGARSLGLPVSDVVLRSGRAAQYFQYGVLVFKQNGAVTRLRAGVDLLENLQKDRPLIDGRRSPSPRTTQGIPNSTIVMQTRTDETLPTPTIAPDFVTAWQRHGGIEILGEPIAPAYRIGATRTQWFEFGRIDLAPDHSTLLEVGLQLALRENVPIDRAERGHLPVFELARFIAFSGDGTLPNATKPFDPVRLKIPAIQINAGIEITTVENGIMTNPDDPWKAGWYAGFSRPGDWTNTVIAGHRDWWGYGPVVFWNLGLLQPGDKIYLLAADGAGATYIVDSNTLVPRTIDPHTIIDDIGFEALTLITCGGTWTGSEYTDRVIIRAHRI